MAKPGPAVPALRPSPRREIDATTEEGCSVVRAARLPFGPLREGLWSPSLGFTENDRRERTASVSVKTAEEAFSLRRGLIRLSSPVSVSHLPLLGNKKGDHPVALAYSGHLHSEQG